MTEFLEPQPLKIGQAARELNLKSYVLRFWESEFPMLRPIRTKSGQRLYGPEQMDVLCQIKTLLYDEGLTIEGARKRLEDGDRPGTLSEIRAELQAILALLE